LRKINGEFREKNYIGKGEIKMDTKLKLNFMDLPLTLVGMIEDGNCEVYKEKKLTYQVRDFVECVHIYSQELMFKLTGKDLHIVRAEMSDTILDFFLNSYNDENGIKIYPQFWVEVQHPDAQFQKFIINELIKQNDIKLGERNERCDN
jgi:hypothetical protein